MLLSVIIVTWNGLCHLPRCLAALLPQLPANAEVIQVDNASRDGTVAWVRANHPMLRLIELSHNTGFAGGVAKGLRAARGQLVLLLNDDAFVEPGFVVALLDVMAAHQEISAASAVLTFDHRPDIVASAGIRLRRDGLALDAWAGRLVTELPHAPVEVFGPSGGAAMYRRSALDDVGGVEPSFFAYLEDVDLAFRLRGRGHRSLLVPQARARHIYSASAGQGSPLKQRLLGRNRLRTLVRCLPRVLLPQLLPHIAAYELMACAYALLTRQPHMLAGRLAALHELPLLLAQRQVIQARTTATA
ncbi:MAG: glycosyltransferase, partial [Roseiflexaceae bacterium]|nr:glycosyltransferase [Roseiflexaceae bacterium]